MKFWKWLFQMHIDWYPGLMATLQNVYEWEKDSPGWAAYGAVVVIMGSMIELLVITVTLPIRAIRYVWRDYV